ncbi:Imm30 family immunity protein [Acinetobacter sp. NIPH 2699]|uniref:Imm30 family immunity protein n=1 Tax=Acinetobacter sp. NIPH 2699 TaxID=2923433 RepID=UPI001F4BCB41|nr:Imm30 family immunity protein [Acinetobacter sp. NIPH 2699]MCH7335090.1 Imm30 family immunity protein [Acinetobacter sp. NIPH 2699]
MTVYAFEQAIKTLVEMVQIDNFGDVQTIDAILAEVMAFNDPSAIRPLMRLIEDTAQHDETIFSIIHSIESFDDEVYISEILKELPYLVHKSPRWASILFMRILNSDSTRECITEKVYFATPEIKAAVLVLIEKINEKNAKFLEKTVTIIVAAKSS